MYKWRIIFLYFANIIEATNIPRLLSMLNDVLYLFM
jgi:hypothetical protein